MKNTMKKLMIALAAAGLVGSVWAGGCGDGCLVYDLKVTLKTLGPKLQKCKSTCDDEKVYYLDTVTRALKGYAWSCDYDCDCSGGNTKLELALWEPKAELGWWLYDKASKTANQNIADLRTNTIRFAKKGNKAAVWFDVEDAEGTNWKDQCADSNYKVVSTLRFVGFGTAVREKKNLDACIVKSVSGNVIGNVTPDVRCAKKSTKKGSWCEDSTTECCADYDIRWACLCNCNVDWCEAVDHQEIMDADDLPKGNDGSARVPAYGTWSMKYNASLSSPKSKVTLTDKLPKYATK